MEALSSPAAPHALLPALEPVVHISFSPFSCSMDSCCYIIVSVTAFAPDFDTQLGYLKASFRPVPSRPLPTIPFAVLWRGSCSGQWVLSVLCAGQFADADGRGGFTFWGHLLGYVRSGWRGFLYFISNTLFPLDIFLSFSNLGSICLHCHPLSRQLSLCRAMAGHLRFQ